MIVWWVWHPEHELLIEETSLGVYFRRYQLARVVLDEKEGVHKLEPRKLVETFKYGTFAEATVEVERPQDVITFYRSTT
jgi:hypothetical protein